MIAPIPLIRTVFVIALSISLNAQSFEWEREIQISKFSGTYARNSVIDHSGNIYLSGVFTTPFTADSAGMFLNKYLPDGSLSWSKVLKNTNMTQVGGGVFLDKADHPWLVCYSVAGELAIGAKKYYGSRTYLVHYNLSGDVISVKKVGYSAPYDVSQDSEKNFYIDGYGKVDTNGIVTRPILGLKVGADDSGYVYHVLQINGARLRKLKPDGDTAWSVKIPENPKVAVSKKGNIALIYGSGKSSSALYYYNSHGHLVWNSVDEGVEYGGIYIDEVENVYLAAKNKIKPYDGIMYVYGFEPSTGKVFRTWETEPVIGTSRSPSNIVVSKGIISVALTDMTVPVKTIVQRYFDESSPATGISDLVQNELIIAPNPSSGIFMLEGLDQLSIISVHNAEGKQVYQITANRRVTIDLSEFSQGIYAIHCSQASGTCVKKIIKE